MKDTQSKTFNVGDVVFYTPPLIYGTGVLIKTPPEGLYQIIKIFYEPRARYHITDCNYNCFASEHEIRHTTQEEYEQYAIENL